MICIIQSKSSRWFKVFTEKNTKDVFVDETDERGNTKQANVSVSRPVKDETQDDCFFAMCKQMRDM